MIWDAAPLSLTERMSVTDFARILASLLPSSYPLPSWEGTKGEGGPLRGLYLGFFRESSANVIMLIKTIEGIYRKYRRQKVEKC